MSEDIGVRVKDFVLIIDIHRDMSVSDSVTGFELLLRTCVITPAQGLKRLVSTVFYAVNLKL